MKCSVVMSTFNKAALLANTLESILKQRPPFDWELIVVDDGSTDATESFWRTGSIPGTQPEIYGYPFVRNGMPIRRLRIDRGPAPAYRNPSVARNVGYRAACGEAVICQSDDVIHEREDAIERLVLDLKPGEFHLATVWSLSRTGQRGMQYVGPENNRPFFFLGSLWRRDLYAIGGCDEGFVSPGYDDDWKGCCLTRGLGLKPVYREDVIGLHQFHRRPHNLEQLEWPSRELYARKVQQAEAGEIPWCSSGGPWAYCP